MDLETSASPRFLNHEELRAQLLTNLEDGSFANFIWKCCMIDCYLRIYWTLSISVVGLILS